MPGLTNSLHPHQTLTKHQDSLRNLEAEGQVTQQRTEERAWNPLMPYAL